MSTLKYTALALAIGASVSMTSPTQAQSRTFVVEGIANESTFDSKYDLWLIDSIQAITGFRMIVTYDDSLMFYKINIDKNHDHIYYEDLDDVGIAFTALRFEFLDSEGNVVEQTQIPVVPDVQTAVIDTFDFMFKHNLDLNKDREVYDEKFYFDFEFIENPIYEGGDCMPTISEKYCSSHRFGLRIDTDRGDAPLFTHDGTRLEPVTYLGNGNFEGRLSYSNIVELDEGYDVARINMYFDLRSIYFDADGDGVADEVDSCDASVTTETIETVMFGTHDSGVANTMGANGCSVTDSYLACDTGGQSMYGGPTYCEMQVAYSLYRDGVVDYSDVRALRTALNNAYRSGAMR